MFALTTPRLVLREVKKTDAGQLFASMACPEVYSMHSNGFRNIADVRRYIAVLEKEYKSGKHRTLAIAEKATDALCGTITIDVHKVFLRAELGYWIAIPHRNQGYATEAVGAVIGYGFAALGLRRIQATHSAGNPASGRVLEKAGMAYEGTLRQYNALDGRGSDAKMYAIVKPDRI